MKQELELTWANSWAGGQHHAKKREASGFCYINDIALAALELLRYHKRILYIDIDVHHGDSVEEFFFTTDRVLTCSFHKFGDFFPGTGSIKDTGIGKGKNYAVNIPLKDGINDESYASVFQPVVRHLMEWYRPEAVLLQCGADSLAGDRLGRFNLSLKGHSDCVRFVKSFGLPVIAMGGGGYTIRNVARAWTYETSILADVELDRGKHWPWRFLTVLSSDLPFNDYLEYYGPDFKLNVESNNMENQNSREYLGKIV